MSPIVVRYQTKPECADENQVLIEAVFAELAESDPDGVRYASLRLEDGTFLHIADIEADPNPLFDIAAFGAFQANIGDRCQSGEGPRPQSATIVGSYGF